MLGKLFKDEFKSYSMPFGITFLAGIIFTVFMKIVCMLPYRGDVKYLVQSFGFYTYYMAIMLISVAAFVFVVVRFYNTTVGDRGYLTWTLPVETSTNLWAKLLAGTLWRVIAGIVMIALFAGFMTGTPWVLRDMFVINGEDVHTLWQFVEQLTGMFKPGYVVPVVLGLLILLVYQAMSHLMIYFCIAIGQLFGKWRLAASVGCYFLLMIVLEILMVAGMAVMTIGGVSAASVGIFERMSVLEIVNIIFLVTLVIGIAFSTLFFALTNWIFKKHLNLE